MTKKGWLRFSIGLISSLVTLSVLGLLVAYGIPNILQSNQHLRIVRNSSNNLLQWYSFDKSASFGSIAPDHFGQASVGQQLIRRVGVGENVKVVDLDNPINKDKFELNLKDSEFKFSEKFKFELANKVIVFQQTPQGKNHPIEFDNDENDQTNKKSINSLEFKSALKNQATTKIELQIRQNVPWVNHQGKIVTKMVGDQKIPYHVEARDWLYGVYRMGMTNNTLRHSPENDNNPFGGHGKLPLTVSKEEWIKTSEALSQQLQSHSSGLSLTSNIGGFNNGYLYDMMNLEGPKDWVKSDDFIKHNHLSFKTKNSESGDFWTFFDKTITSSWDLIPVPARYIDDVASKIDNVANIRLPRDDSNIRKYAQFTYGTTFDKTLYVSPYYVSESNGFRNKLEFNQHYWDHNFTSDKNRILSWTEEFIQTSEKEVFYQSLFDQYNNNRTYVLEPEFQSADKLQKMRLEPEKYGLRYENKINLKFPNTVVSNMLPLDNQTHFYNDNFAKMWFGTSLNDIEKGQMLFQNFLKPEIIALRSQLFAVVNIYTQLRTVDPLNKFSVWNSYFPPDVVIKPDGNNFSHYHEQLSEVNYWTFDNNQLTPQKIKLAENIESQKNTTQTNAIKSAHFEKIQNNFKQTLDKVLGKDLNNQIEFQLRNRFLNPSPQHTRYFEHIIQVFQALDPRLKPSLKITNLSQEISEYHFSSAGIFQTLGWGPDYEGTGTWLTGLNNGTSSIAALALSLASSNHQWSKNFIHLKQYGAKLGQYIDEYISNNIPLKDFFISPIDGIKKLTNKGLVNLNATNLIKILSYKSDKQTTQDQLIKLEETFQDLKKYLANIDLKIQNETKFDESWFVNLSQEYSSIVGYGFEERSFVLNKAKPQEVIWKPWLILPKLKNGTTYLQDVRLK